VRSFDFLGWIEIFERYDVDSRLKFFISAYEDAFLFDIAPEYISNKKSNVKVKAKTRMNVVRADILSLQFDSFLMS